MVCMGVHIYVYVHVCAGCVCIRDCVNMTLSYRTSN